MRAGTENSRHANELDQDIVEVHDDSRWSWDAHTLTFGTHNEFFKFRNLFIRDNFGNYEFATIDLFEQGLAQSYDYSFSLTSDPLEAAEFTVHQFGFYAGDQWRDRSRTDADLWRCGWTSRSSRTSRRANPFARDDVRLRTDVVPAAALWSPRAGFNWDLRGDGRGSRSAAASDSSPAARRTSGCRTSTATRASSSRALSVTNNATNRIPFVADPLTPADDRCRRAVPATRST